MAPIPSLHEKSLQSAPASNTGERKLSLAAEFAFDNRTTLAKPRQSHGRILSCGSISPLPSSCFSCSSAHSRSPLPLQVPLWQTLQPNLLPSCVRATATQGTKRATTKLFAYSTSAHLRSALFSPCGLEACRSIMADLNASKAPDASPSFLNFYNIRNVFTPSFGQVGFAPVQPRTGSFPQVRGKCRRTRQLI